MYALSLLVWSVLTVFLCGWVLLLDPNWFMNGGMIVRGAALVAVGSLAVILFEVQTRRDRLALGWPVMFVASAAVVYLLAALVTLDLVWFPEAGFWMRTGLVILTLFAAVVGTASHSRD